MMDSEDKKIDIEGVDPRELYGPQNIYLEQMQELHPNLKIIARGSALTVLGPRSDSERFRKRLDGLIAYYLKYGYISKESVQQAFSTGVIEHDAPVDKDVIVYGNNGTIVRARTVNQLKLVQSYDRNDLLLAIGPAGSGKTYTAIALAVRALKEKHVKRIILTRPAVEAGEKLGFLPGDMKEKLDPYLQPLYDALNDMIPPAKLQKYIEEGTVQIAPLAYMRGRTLDNAFVILDEAQNTTVEQMKMFLTRLGFGSIAVVTGDMTQVDLPRHTKSGLRHAIEVLKENDVIAKLAEEFHGPVKFALHGFSAPAFFLALMGFFLATLLYMVKPEWRAGITRTLAWPIKVLENKYFLDWFNEHVLAAGTRLLGKGLWKGGDQAMIDGAIVNGSWKLVGWVSGLVRWAQSGYLYHYAFAMILGLVALLALANHYWL